MDELSVGFYLDALQLLVHWLDDFEIQPIAIRQIAGSSNTAMPHR